MNDNKITAYQESIGILMSGAVDYKAVVVKLAQTHPELFVSLYNGETSADYEQKRYAKMIYENNGHQLIPAIKEVRAKFNLGLKEAKDLVDSIR